MAVGKQGKSYALIGVAGYIARRHLSAIKDTGGSLAAAFDVGDSVGQMDASFPEARFFTEFERFGEHVERLRAGGQPIDYMQFARQTICTSRMPALRCARAPM